MVLEIGLPHTMGMNIHALEKSFDPIKKTPVLDVGPSATDNQIGVYCEREKRVANACSYMVYCADDRGRCASHLFSVLLELQVDRNRRSSGKWTVHDQWCQLPGAVHVQRIYFHAMHIREVVQRSYWGYLRVDNRTMRWLIFHKRSGARRYRGENEIKDFDHTTLPPKHPPMGIVPESSRASFEVLS